MHQLKATLSNGLRALLDLIPGNGDTKASTQVLKGRFPLTTRRRYLVLSAESIAAYFLAKAAQEDGELISNLKLQKLLYYAQGAHMALDKGILFPEPIAAWNHGPVVTSVYHKYKEFGADSIPAPADFDPTQYSEEMQDFLDEVYTVYGQFSAGKLRKMTHEEPPWKEAFENNRGNISPDTMKTFFKTLLIQDDGQRSTG